MKLTQILEKLEAVSNTGPGSFLAVCPSHDDTNPSLVVSVSDAGKALIHCRSGCSLGEVLNSIGMEQSDLFDIEIDADQAVASASNAPVAPAEQALLMQYLVATQKAIGEKTIAADRALKMAADRFGMTPVDVGRFGLGVDDGFIDAPDFISHVWQRTPRLVVPFKDAKGVPRGAQGRDLSGTDETRWCSLSNPAEGSWNKTAYFSAGTGLDSVVLTEGPSDALTAAMAGIDSIAIRGASLAAGASDELLGALDGQRVVIMGDNDDAGTGFVKKLGTALTAEDLDICSAKVPAEFGDINEWKTDGDDFHKDFIEAVRGASPVTVENDPEPDKSIYENLGTTQAELADAFVDHMKSNIIITEGSSLYLYDGASWVRDERNSILESIVDFFRLVSAEGIRLLAIDDEDKLGKRLYRTGNANQNIQSAKGISEMLLTFSRLHVNTDEIDAHPHLLAVNNGIVDLSNGDLLPFDKSLLITKKLAFDFDPSAKAPQWESFMKATMDNDNDMVEFLQRLLGYGLTGETSEQCFGIFVGVGATGKSTLTDTIRRVTEGVSHQTAFSTFEKRQSGAASNDVAVLRGKRLVLASEGDQGKPMAESLLKTLSGGDRVTARFLYSEFFSYTPQFLILLATNHMPTFKSQDSGLWRRIKVVRFMNAVPVDDRDHQLGLKLMEEAEGILAWLVRGSVEWHTLGGLAEPRKVILATADFKETANPLEGFLPGILNITDDHDQVVERAEVWRAYTRWVEREALGREASGRNLFYARLNDHGIPMKQVNGQRCFTGVTLTEPDTKTGYNLGRPS